MELTPSHHFVDQFLVDISRFQSTAIGSGKKTKTTKLSLTEVGIRVRFTNIASKDDSKAPVNIATKRIKELFFFAKDAKKESIKLINFMLFVFSLWFRGNVVVLAIFLVFLQIMQLFWPFSLHVYRQRG